MSDLSATVTDRASVSQTRGVPIVLDELTKTYPGAEGPAVDAISLDIPAGELVVFVGPSGCGKTTTMRMINRLITPTSGRVLIDDDDVAQLNDTTLRRSIGYVIQQIGLFPHLTIGANIAVVPKLLKWDKDRIDRRIDAMLEVVGLAPSEFRHRYPRQLSGGQQQRVGVARALAADPPTMLMDEPFGAVDPITRQRLQDEFKNLQRELGKTVVFVTHDFDEALKLGDRICILNAGSTIEQYDTPARILAAPANDFVRGFIGHGATLKRLQFEQITDDLLGPVTASHSSLERDSSLHEVLDHMLGTGQDLVTITRDGDPVGSLTLERLLNRTATLREAGGEGGETS